MTNELKPFDTVTALAEHTGLSVYMLRSLVRESKLPYIKSGKKFLINTSRALRILDNESITGTLEETHHSERW